MKTQENENRKSSIKERIINETLQYIKDANMQVGDTLEKLFEYNHYVNQYEYTIMMNCMNSELLNNDNIKVVYTSVNNLKKLYKYNNHNRYNANKKLFYRYE